MLVPPTHRTWLSTRTISCISPAVPSGRPCSSSLQTRSSSGITVTSSTWKELHSSTCNELHHQTFKESWGNLKETPGKEVKAIWDAVGLRRE